MRSAFDIGNPESMTATTTDGEPVTMSHASGASMSASAAPVRVMFCAGSPGSGNTTVWPVLCSAHWFGVKRGSFGMAPSRRMPTGAADTTPAMALARATAAWGLSPCAVSSRT